MQKGLLIFTLLLPLSVFSQRPDPSNFGGNLATIESLYQRKDYIGLIEQLNSTKYWFENNALNHTKEYHQLLTWLGEAYTETNNLNAALKNLEASFTFFGKNFPQTTDYTLIRALLARVYIQLGDRQTAAELLYDGITDYRNYIREMGKKNLIVDSALILGIYFKALRDLFSYTNHLAKSEQAYQRAIKILGGNKGSTSVLHYTTFASTYSALAEIQEQQGNDDLSLQNYKNAVLIYENFIGEEVCSKIWDYVNVLTKISTWYLHHKDVNQAEPILVKALNLGKSFGDESIGL